MHISNLPSLYLTSRAQLSQAAQAKGYRICSNVTTKVSIGVKQLGKVALPEEFKLRNEGKLTLAAVSAEGITDFG